MPPKLERSVTGATVSVGVQGTSAIVKGVIDILAVFPYLFAKVVSLAVSALKYAGQNIAQTIGTVVMIIFAVIWVDSIYDIRGALSCFIKPSLCAGADVRVR